MVFNVRYLGCGMGHFFFHKLRLPFCEFPLGPVMKLSTNDARLVLSATFQQRKRTLVGSACILGIAAAVAVGPTAAAAKAKAEPRSKHDQAERFSKEPFGDVPKGPIQIFISIDQQKLFLYSDGVAIAEAEVATGVPGHDTPMGVFSVIAKDRFHHSNIYSNAPMPFMQRITWSGVALHEGVGVGHRASHGCIRMPHEFALRLWTFTKLGARVIIARNELRPAAFADAHLFVHKTTQPAPSAAVAAPVKTAQTADANTSTDARVSPPTTVLVNDKPVLVPTTRVMAAEAAAAPVSGATFDPPVPHPSDDASRAAAGKNDGVQLRGSDPGSTPAVIAPLPQPKPAVLVEASRAPIAIFISRKTGRIYVRQHFEPLFDAPITIDHPEKPFGTHVFTAMEYLNSEGSAFRWNVVSLPVDQPKPVRNADSLRGSERHAKGHRREALAEKPAIEPPPAPEDVLARIGIPQDVMDQISLLIVPGSSLIVSDQGLGEETGEGTDFIVVAR